MNIRKIFGLFAIICGTFFYSNGYTQTALPKGSLFIIGGGERSPELIKELVKTAHFLPTDYGVVLPMASEAPDTAFKYIDLQLKAATDKKIIQLNFDSLSVNDPTKLRLLSSAKLIYIPGGDQNRFMKVVLHTKVYDAIHKAYRNGSTVAGTSAGAAVMSKYMITGKQLKGDTAYKATFEKLWKNNIEFEEGLGLLDSTIIDQHFIKRSRYNRLLSALDGKPNFDCIGIDEATALVIHKKHAKVVGASQILMFSNMNTKNMTPSARLIKFKSINFTVFSAGDTFIIK